MRIRICDCGVKLMMVEHVKTGRTAPIEVQPSLDGNVLVTGDLYEIVPVDERAAVQRRGFVLRKNHFATCARAGSYKRQKDQAE